MNYRITIEKMSGKGLYIQFQDKDSYHNCGTYIRLEKPISQSHIDLIKNNINFLLDELEETQKELTTESEHVRNKMP